jgi:hypothetical protein
MGDDRSLDYRPADLAPRVRASRELDARRELVQIDR